MIDVIIFKKREYVNVVYIYCMQIVSPCHTHLEAMDPPVSQKLSDVKAPSFNQGFSHACAGPEIYLIGERGKKRSSHTKPRLRGVPLITSEVAASF